ncbi:MAG: FeoA family protein [Armatimonadota bacterium]|nr:FeoA family protein [Armatimonadota bacterium]MDR7549717.1 FeoA family protein [Armatimonadota bacterium]
MEPLSTLKPGTTARLGPPSGLDPEVVGELAALRILPGEVVTILEAVGRGGPLLVQGAGGVFALGRRLAARLSAEILDP